MSDAPPPGPARCCERGSVTGFREVSEAEAEVYFACPVHGKTTVGVPVLGLVDFPELVPKPPGPAGTPPSRFRCPICDRAGDAYGCEPGRCRARWLAGCNACGDSYQVETRVMADAWFAGHEGSPTCRANRPSDPALRSRWRRKSDGVEAWVAKFIGFNLTLLQGAPDEPDPVKGFQVFHETMQTLRDAWEPVS